MVMPKIVKPAVVFDDPVTKSSSESIVSIASSKISQVEKNKRSSNDTPRKMPPVVKKTPSVIQGKQNKQKSFIRFINNFSSALTIIH